jgi:phage baseplate assembly protein gpV
MWSQKGLKLGIVVAVYPEGNSIDVLMPKSGDRLANVQCAAFTGSDSSGIMDLPEIGLPVDDTRWTMVVVASAPRYVRAIIADIDGLPICMGFVLPQVTQMTFQRNNFRVSRHASDVYSTTNENGDHEWYHPSGTFLRVAASPAHEDLTAQDVDQSWKLKQNLASAPYVNLVVANAGAQVAQIEFDPSGNITINHNGNLTVNTKGNAAVTVQGTTTVTSTGDADIKAPNVTIDSPQTTCTGALTVQGPLAFQSGMTGQAGSSGGDTMVITGDATISGTVTGVTDVLAAGISGKGHKHPGVQSGGSETDPPSNS